MSLPVSLTNKVSQLGQLIEGVASSLETEGKEVVASPQFRAALKGAETVGATFLLPAVENLIPSWMRFAATPVINFLAGKLEDAVDQHLAELGQGLAAPSQEATDIASSVVTKLAAAATTTAPAPAPTK